MSKEDEIRDAMAQERSRGRKQPLVDPASRRRRNEMLKAVRAALQQNDERHFLEAIRRHLGLKDGSPEFLKAWQAWRDFHGKS